MAVRHAFLALCIAGMTACTSVPVQNGKSQSVKAKPQDRLVPRNLDSGECGLFVWSAEAVPRFILFSQAEDPMGRWWNGKKEIEIARISSEGFEAQGQSPVQNFNNPEEGSLSLALRDPEEVDNGTRFKGGAITQTNVDGWEKVIPVFGLAGCNLNPKSAQYSVRTIL